MIAIDKSPLQGSNETTGVTREARLYAVRELLLRAGVPVEELLTWKITVGPQWTEIRVASDPPKHLRFRADSFRNWDEVLGAQFSVVRASWMHPPDPHVGDLVPDFIIPFTRLSFGDRRPLFHQVASDCVECGVDLPLTALLTLSRFEELGAGQRDDHGRFVSSSSVAGRHGYLGRPIVDEYGLAVEQALNQLLPNRPPAQRKLRVKLSHDVDRVGIPCSLRATVGHTLKRRTPSATFRDFVASFTGEDPIYLALVSRIAGASLERDLDSAFYWKSSLPGPYDSGYDPRHPKIRRVIDWLSERGIENGIHPGYETFGNLPRLSSEVRRLREVVNNDKIGGRQHFLRWRPESWTEWEACGLAYDSTVGFADEIGFRAGTCIPYRPWIFSLNRQADLLEIPLIVMDCTPVVYMRLSLAEGLAAVLRCVERCRLVGGVFTLLWHNTTLLEPAYGNLYDLLLDHLAGADRFNWKAVLEGTR